MRLSKKRAWLLAGLVAEIIFISLYLNYRFHFALNQPLTDQEDALAEYAVPSKEENQILNLLEARFASLKDQAVFPIGCGGVKRDKPCDVKDALESLNHEIVLPPVCGHAMAIRTRLNHWKRGLPVAKSMIEKTQLGNGESRFLGYYQWLVVDYYKPKGNIGGKDVLVFSNRLFLDSDGMRKNERNLRGQLENMGVFYHELLHAQFVIDAMRSNDQWRKTVCSDRWNIDFGVAMDPHHERIWKLDGLFLRNIADLITRKKFSLASS